MLAATVLRKYWAVAAALVAGVVVLAWFHGQAVVDASALTGSSLWVIFGGCFCLGAVLFGLPALRTPRRPWPSSLSASLRSRRGGS